MARKHTRIDLDETSPFESVRKALGMTHTQFGEAIGTSRQGASQLAARGDEVLLSTLREKLRLAGFDVKIVAVRREGTT